MKILALAGFLGTETDFDPFFSDWQGSVERKTLSVSTAPFRASPEAWPQWTGRTLSELKTWKGTEPVLGIGYSLGGRLLGSLIERDPDFFSAAVFMSVNPGLKDENEKRDRESSDRHWADRFENENWTTLMRAWGAQAVFQGGALEPERLESDYDRRQLAACLREFSLAKQSDFRSWIRGWHRPQLWMAGEKDSKFAALLRSLQADTAKKEGTIRFEIVPSASHRIFLDQPGPVAERVRRFLTEVFDRPG